MLQPTDRVIAKVLARVLRDIAKEVTSNTLEAALVLTERTMPYVAGNSALSNAIGDLLKEVAEEVRAEERGDAVPYPLNSPQPSTN